MTNNCQFCNKNFIKKANNQKICGNKECKRLQVNKLNTKFRNLKRKITYINCHICSKPFEKFRRNKSCSKECKRKAEDIIKLKYYIKNVMPNLKYKPKLSENEKIERKRVYLLRYNNTPERKLRMKNYRRIPEIREKEKIACNNYKQRNPNNCKNGYLKRNYNITLDDYLNLLLNQNSVCKICKKEETSKNNKKGKIKDLAVDHCHKSGKIRGLLCTRCNTTLGRVEDSIELLENMINYLKENA